MVGFDVFSLGRLIFSEGKPLVFKGHVFIHHLKKVTFAELTGNYMKLYISSEIVFVYVMAIVC